MTAGHLAVSEVFGPTFQGEGPSSGQRCGFVRLARCNLDCDWCDTPYTWDWSRFDPAKEITDLSPEAVLERLDSMGIDRVVVTGGEPLLQQRALTDLLAAFERRGWPVEIETNGTVRPTPDIVRLVERFNVSPKLANSGMSEDRRVVPAALEALRDTGRAVFKFVVAEEGDLDEIADLVDRFGLTPVWVMPEGTDEATVVARMRLLADPVLERGWNLTSRLHVLLWGDQRGK
jgi:7-carboxy-7-deazaguanine synthase